MSEGYAGGKREAPHVHHVHMAWKQQFDSAAKSTTKKSLDTAPAANKRSVANPVDATIVPRRPSRDSTRNTPAMAPAGHRELARERHDSHAWCSVNDVPPSPATA